MTRIERILLVPHTHHDVGYTNSPRLVDRGHREIVDRVLDLAAEHPDDGPAAFRWTFEVARPVLTFLATAPPQRVAELVRRCRSGQLAVTGGYLNMTQLPDLPEIEHAFAQVTRLREHGLDVRTVQHGDVNGISWGAVDAMRRHGLDRLVMALNPDHGRAPREQPSLFSWQGPGGDAVLTLLSTHYGYGEEWGIVDGAVDLATRSIERFCQRLDERDDWPYRTAVVHAGNDNRWPTAAFLDLVGHWNRAHPERPMATATMDAALDLLQQEAGELPVLRGEWSDWWSHGHGSTAREVAVYREARRLLAVAEAALGALPATDDPAVPLAQVLGYRRGPVRLREQAELAAEVERVHEALALFAEHTWGAWETYSAPDSVFNASHWNAKAGFAYDAYDRARDLAVELLHRRWVRATGDARTAVHAPPSDRVVVANESGSDRTDLVDVEVPGAGVRTVLARVPARSAVTLTLPTSGPARPTDVVELGRYRVHLDTALGAIGSLVHLPTGTELAGRDGLGFGGVVAEVVDPGDEHPMLRDPKSFNPDHPGPRFVQVAPRGSSDGTLHVDGDVATLRWESETPGTCTSVHELALAETDDTLRYRVTVHKPVRDGFESLFVHFPFALAHADYLVETAGAVYRAGSEQLPDTSLDWQSLQHAIGVVGDRRGVLWSTTDAPLVRLGGHPIGAWSRRWQPRAVAVDSWVMNNLHFTNFQARQGGRVPFTYRLRPTDPSPDADDVAAFGASVAVPLVARSLLQGQRVATTGAAGSA